jgi:voltage-gated potassium channel
MHSLSPPPPTANTPENAYLRLRRWFFVTLELEGTQSFASQLIRVALILTILMSTACLVTETIPTLNRTWRAWLYQAELATMSVFALEYILRVWVAVERPRSRYKHAILGRLRYMLTPMAIVDMLALLPFMIKYSQVPLHPEYVLLIQFLRIAKIVRYNPAMKMLGQAFYAERQAALAAGVIVSILILFAASGIWVLENDVQPENFGSIPQALWWAVVTVTTLGYGDVVPQTDGGKAFAGLIAIAGLMMFSLPAAILSTGFMQQIKQRDFMTGFDLVARVTVFNQLDPKRISEIANLLKTLRLPPRYTIIRRQEQPDMLYFIVEGQVDAELPDGQHLTLKNGDFFGDLDAFGNHISNSASFISLTETTLLTLNNHEFNRLVLDWPDLAMRMRQMAITIPTLAKKDLAESDGYVS